MKAHKFIFSIITTLILLITDSPCSAQENLPRLSETLKIIQNNLIGVKNETLDEKALHGLISELSPLVKFKEENPPTNPNVSEQTSEAPSYRLLSNHYIAFRVGEINNNTAHFIAEKYKAESTNEIRGLILDLRNTSSEDYTSTANIASLFLGKDLHLFTIGDHKYLTQTSEDVDLLKLPTAILVNKNTAGAPEALAITLNRHLNAIILGSKTAGDLFSFKEFAIQGNSSLLIAVDTVYFDNNTLPPSDGIIPDIEVSLSQEDEIAYIKDPFTNLHPVPLFRDGETNNVSIKINEATLVKMQRGGRGNNSSEEQTEKILSSDNKEPIIYDPTLSRALDILKSLYFFKK